MGKFTRALIVTAAAVLAACSGSENTIVGQGGNNGGLPPVDVASLTLLTSNPQILSDGANPATITALVRDANNNVVSGVPVLFSASSGSLVLSNPITTDDTGIVTATLSTGGDPTNRTITVSATADAVGSSIDVNVIGTQLDLNGPQSLPVGSSGITYNVVLTNAGGDGIPGQQVTITSSSNNLISQTPLITDADGQASFTLTANTGGADTLTATALGQDAILTVNVSADVFAFTTPDPATEIPLSTAQTVTVNWQDAAGPIVGDTVTFTTTRGTLVPANGVATTDASGNATVTVSSTNAGTAVLTATNSLNTSTTRTVAFVATVPATLELQADPFTVPTSGQSTITAIVRDPNGNLVKGATVSFSLTDSTNGQLSVAQAVTNSQGRAQTFYTASSTTSSVDGVRIDAVVVGAPSVTDAVFLTVGQRELFFSIGTGNTIFEPNSTQYRKEWVIQVTDANGNGVANVSLTTTILSERYFEGTREWNDVASAWQTIYTATCLDEDADRNGILDLINEDANGNGRIEAGNIATVTAQGSAGTTVTTDSNGFVLLDVYYAQEYALWVEVTLEAKTAVNGTEFAERTTFLLPISADDVATEGIEPPGRFSPWGTDGNCLTPPPPDGT
jgi:hypothetical protein